MTTRAVTRQELAPLGEPPSFEQPEELRRWLSDLSERTVELSRLQLALADNPWSQSDLLTDGLKYPARIGEQVRCGVAMTVCLPEATQANRGGEVFVKKDAAGSFTVDVVVAGGGDIDGSPTLAMTGTRGDRLFASTGDHWMIQT